MHITHAICRAEEFYKKFTISTVINDIMLDITGTQNNSTLSSSLIFFFYLRTLLVSDSTVCFCLWGKYDHPKHERTQNKYHIIGIIT